MMAVSHPAGDILADSVNPSQLFHRRPRPNLGPMVDHVITQGAQLKDIYKEEEFCQQISDFQAEVKSNLDMIRPTSKGVGGAVTVCQITLSVISPLKIMWSRTNELYFDTYIDFVDCFCFSLAFLVIFGVISIYFYISLSFLLARTFQFFDSQKLVFEQHRISHFKEQSETFTSSISIVQIFCVAWPISVSLLTGVYFCVFMDFVWLPYNVLRVIIYCLNLLGCYIVLFLLEYKIRLLQKSYEQYTQSLKLLSKVVTAKTEYKKFKK